jgi:hypothetical protein
MTARRADRASPRGPARPRPTRARTLSLARPARAALRACALLLGLAIAYAAAAAVGPRLARWQHLRLLGDGYACVEVAGRSGASYEVYLPRSEGAPDAARVAGTIDGFVDAACDGPAGLGFAPPGDLLRVILFAGQEDLERYAGVAFNRHLGWNGGFYFARTREIGLVRAGRSFASVAVDLRHEATHLLFDVASAEGLSPWLGEGLACRLEHAGPGAGPDRYRATAAAAAMRDGPLGLARLLDAPQDVFLEPENERWYALADATVDYLLDGAGPELRSRFLRHIALERGGARRGAAGLVRDLGVDAAGLDRRVRAWLRAGAVARFDAARNPR